MKCPCENCITLALCKQRYLKIIPRDDGFTYISKFLAFHPCELLKEFIDETHQNGKCHNILLGL